MIPTSYYTTSVTPRQQPPYMLTPYQATPGTSPEVAARLNPHQRQFPHVSPHAYEFPTKPSPHHVPVPAQPYFNVSYLQQPLLPPANVDKAYPAAAAGFSGYDRGLPAQFTFRTHKKSSSYQEMGSKPAQPHLSSPIAPVSKPKKAKTSTLISKSTINYPIHQLSHSHTIPHNKAQELKNTLYPGIEVKKYSTSAIDPVRNYLTVYEYSINNHWIIWDYETGFVHLTGIWKASLSASMGDNVAASPSQAATSSSSLKADIVKLLESTPKQYQPYIKRIRGGFLKIQGTWLPFNLCKVLARRFCYYIRYELVPIFGVDFPDYCLKPSDRGFGELKLDDVPSDQQQLDYYVPQELHESEAKRALDHGVFADKRRRTSTSVFDSRAKDAKAKLLPLPQPTYMHSYMESPSAYTAHRGEPVTPINTELSRYSLGTGGSAFSSVSSASSAASAASVPALPHGDPDVMDIVSASRCLQSLRKPSQTSPIAAQRERANSTGRSYTITTAHSDTGDAGAAGDAGDHARHSSTEGISSILLAAGVADPDYRGPRDIAAGAADGAGSEPAIRRASMKINDLLT